MISTHQEFSRIDASPRLLDLLSQVPNPRRAEGKRHPLPAVLSLLVLVMMAGLRRLQGVVDCSKVQVGLVAHVSNAPDHKGQLFDKGLPDVDRLLLGCICEAASRVWDCAVFGPPSNTGVNPGIL